MLYARIVLISIDLIKRKLREKKEKEKFEIDENDESF